MPSQQQFHMGDRVFYEGDPDNLDETLRPKCEAIVLCSHQDRNGDGREGRDWQSYSIFLRGLGRIEWFSPSDLGLIETNRCDLYVTWQAELEITELTARVAELEKELKDD